MTIHGTSPFGIISLAETKIEKPKDLEGKRLAITAGDALTQLFPAFAKSSNLDMSKITLVQIDPAGKVVALLEKRVDAILGGLDDQYFLVKQKGANPAGMKFADHGANTVGLTLIANQSTIDEKPDLVKRFLKATARSWQAAIKEPGCRDRRVAEDKTGPRPHFAKGPVDGGYFVHCRRTRTRASRSAIMPPADWERTMQILKEYRDLKTDKPATAFYTNDFIPTE